VGVKRKEAVDIVCFLLILAFVFAIGFQAGRNSVPEYVKAIDQQVNRPSFGIP